MLHLLTRNRYFRIGLLLFMFSINSVELELYRFFGIADENLRQYQKLLMYK